MSAKLKNAMPVGSKWRVMHHRPLCGSGQMGVRTVVKHRSQDMMLECSEFDERPEMNGKISYLQYPKVVNIVLHSDGKIVILDDNVQSRQEPLLTYTPYEG